MYRIYRADKDAYITDRVINTVRRTGANTGRCGTLDLFKLYGYNVSGSSAEPLYELSRLLVHFDITGLRTLFDDGKFDPGNSSFSCTLKLFDVYGGQPTPANFTVTASPLSRSFDEGLGRDLVQYADTDACNFLTASWTSGSWYASGCGLGGVSGQSVDFITSSLAGTSLSSEQLFHTGEEDLELDVTTVISATLAGTIDDHGFRIALSSSLEDDVHTYFVKRFASRHAYDESKHPRLIVRYDDSIEDDSQDLYLDATSTLFMHNYVRGVHAILASGSALTPITGTNCVILKLSTDISGGTYTLAFSGSQHFSGINAVMGVYSASVYIPSTNANVISKLALSSSIAFTPVWGSVDGSVGYVTGSTIYAYPAQRVAATIDSSRYHVNIYGLRESYNTTDTISARVNVLDHSSPTIRLVKTPVELPGVVLRDVHFQVRDAVTNVIEIPFDTVYNSTRCSSDSMGMYFSIDASSLTKDRSYVVDVSMNVGDGRHVYKAASPTFRVSDVQ
jgi:hypothetical protein